MSRRGVGRVVCAVLVALVLASPVAVADAVNTEARPKLRDGFVVAAGSKLLGPVFPAFGLTNRVFAGWSGWNAVLDVTGDAGPVFDQYVEQARALGLDVSYSDRSCREESPGDVLCGALAIPADGQLQMTLHVCTTCAIPVSSMTIQLINKTGALEFGASLERTAPPAGFAVHLDAEMRQRQRRALPKAGQAIPWEAEPETPLLAGPKAPLRVAAGTTAIAAAKEDCGFGGFVAVLRSDRAVGDIFAKYRRQVERQANEVRPTATRRTRGKTATAVVTGDYASVTVVGDRSGTSVLARECFGF